MSILEKPDLTQEGVGYKIIYDSKDFLILDKRYGIAVQATDSDQDDLETVLTRKLGYKVFVVNRIDMPVSGLVIFGKNVEFTRAMTEKLKERDIEKIYLAIVKGNPIKDKPQTITHFIKKLHNRAMTADEKINEAYKESALTYEWLQSFDNYELLKIILHSGRFHQIRAQLATIEMPIKGDLKYGSRRPNMDRSICLVSYKLRFEHPLTGEKYSFTAELPKNEVMWEAIDSSLLEKL